MSNEPKAGMNLDPEMLAAYIDHRLTPEQRAAVEAQLANDPDSYSVLVETIRAQDVLDASASRQSRVSGGRRWWAIAGGLAAAAIVLLAVIQRQPRAINSDPLVEKLVAAVADQRLFEARVTGGFGYAPLRVTRGVTDDNLSLRAAASEVTRRAQSNPTIPNRHAAALALLQLGDDDRAVTELESIAESSNDATIRSDLAAAYVTLAQRSGGARRAAKAIENAAAALAINPGLNEARFNLALATEIAGSRGEAIARWTDYLSHESQDDWRREVTARIDRLKREP